MADELRFAFHFWKNLLRWTTRVLFKDVSGSRGIIPLPAVGVRDLKGAQIDLVGRFAD